MLNRREMLIASSAAIVAATPVFSHVHASAGSSGETDKTSVGSEGFEVTVFIRGDKPVARMTTLLIPRPSFLLCHPAESLPHDMVSNAHSVHGAKIITASWLPGARPVLLSIWRLRLRDGFRSSVAYAGMLGAKCDLAFLHLREAGLAATTDVRCLQECGIDAKHSVPRAADRSGVKVR